MVFSIKMLLDNTLLMGYWISLNLNEIILLVPFKQNLNIQIQILAGNPVNSKFSAGSQISCTLNKT